MLKQQSSFIEREISYAKMIKKSEYKIQWNSSESSISKMILGLYPNAYTYYRNKRLKILKAIPLTSNYSAYLDCNLIDAGSLLNNSIPNSKIKINKRYIIFLSQYKKTFTCPGFFQLKKINNQFLMLENF